MTKKIKYLFLAFSCLFFINVGSVKAYDYNLTIDFASIEEEYQDFEVTDTDTGTVYHGFEIFDKIIDEYSSEYKFMIFPYCRSTDSGSYRLKFYLYVSNVDKLYLSIHEGTETTTLYFNSATSWDSFIDYYNGGEASSFIPNQFSWSALKNKLDEFFNTTEFSDANLAAPWFWKSHDYVVSGGDNNYFPYYSNITLHYQDYINDRPYIDVIYKNIGYRYFKKDDMEHFFYRSGFSHVVSSHPVPSITFSNVQNDVNNIVTGVTVTIDFSEFMLDTHTHMYAIADNWNIIENVNSFYLDYNTVVTAKSCSIDSGFCFNVRSYNVDFIGKSLDYYYEWLENKYNNDFEDELNGIVLTEDSPVESYLQYWFLQFKRTFPIVFQIGDILSLFDNEKQVSVCANNYSACIPDWKINFSFLGHDVSYSVFDWSFWFTYRNQVHSMISLFCALYTFVRIQDLLKEMSKKQ